jgi:plasmid stabilization system protein ParE
VKLRYTLSALADLSSILDYIAAQSPQGARNVHTRIQVIIDLLRIDVYDDNIKGTMDWIERVNTRLFRTFDSLYAGEYDPKRAGTAN